MTDLAPFATAIDGGPIGLVVAMPIFTPGHNAGGSGISQETLPPWQDGADNRRRPGFVLGAFPASLVILAEAATANDVTRRNILLAAPDWPASV